MTTDLPRNNYFFKFFMASLSLPCCAQGLSLVGGVGWVEELGGTTL